MSAYEPDVSDGFALLAHNTDLSLSEYLAITQAQAGVEQCLQQKYNAFSTTLPGAFSRKTMISPLQDTEIDLLVLFKDLQTKNRLPSQVFRELSEFLQEKYPEAVVDKDDNSVRLPVGDFTFCARPGYSLDEHVYMLPSDTFNEWVKYDVQAYNDYFMRENVRHRGELAAIIRMLKTWNRVSGRYFSGYYLELLVIALLARCDSKNLAETICYIFENALNEVVFQKQDPANKAFNVEGLYDIDNLIKAMLLFKKSWQTAEQAIQLERAGNMAEAIELWRRIFPGVFPDTTDMLVGKLRKEGLTGADALRIMLKHKV